MEANIENAKVINKKIPEVLEYSDQYRKEMRKILRLNNIFSEFETKASKDLSFYIDESNRRYSKSKCGINLKGLISATRKKCLDESKKILNDNFYHNKIISSEKEKMKHKGNVFLYKKLRNSMNIVKNPELLNKRMNTENNVNSNKNILLKRNNNEKKGRNILIKNNSRKYFDRNEKILDKIIDEEQNLLSKSIDNYKSNLDNLKNMLDKKVILSRRKNSMAFRKINLFLPNLKFMNYASMKIVPKKLDFDDPNKKADIHKLLPFSKSGKKNEQENLIIIQQAEKRLSRKIVIFPYITEPNLPKKNTYTNKPQNYKDYQNTISVVADSANKELFVNQKYDKKRNEIENILKVDDIPKVQFYDDLAHQKANEIKEERRRKNIIISEKQNYLKLTMQQRMNLDIDKNINLITNIENNLYNKENKKVKNNMNK